MKKNIILTLTCLLMAMRISAADIGRSVIISEIFYDSPLNEQIAQGIPYSNGEYIELYNTSPEPVDISSWQMTGGGVTEKYVFAANTVIPAHGFILLVYQYNSLFTFDYIKEELPLKRIIYQKKIILSNAGETVSLLDNEGGVQDHIYYDGTSNKKKKNRLFAENPDSHAWNFCRSLHRVNAGCDLDGKIIAANSDWIAATINPFQADVKVDDAGIELFNGRNYIHTRSYTRYEYKPLPGRLRAQYTDEVKYYDGLGYLEEVVKCRFTPDGKDMTILQEYDFYKHPTKLWLPTVTSENVGAYTDPDVLKAQSVLDRKDQNPYTEDVFDTSSTDRKFRHYEPGQNWRSLDIGEKVAYYVNDSSDSLHCIQFSITGSDVHTRLSKGCNYPGGTLSVARTRAEDGTCFYEFKNDRGQVVLNRTVVVKNGDTTNYDTYFVCDIYDNLCYVLPPALSAMETVTDYSDTAAVMQQYAYVYK